MLIKNPLASFSHVLATEIPLIIMKNAFQFTNFFFSLNYLNFCLDFFGHVRKQLDKQVKIIFKIYGK